MDDSTVVQKKKVAEGVRALGVLARKYAKLALKLAPRSALASQNLATMTTPVQVQTIPISRTTSRNTKRTSS